MSTIEQLTFAVDDTLDSETTTMDARQDSLQGITPELNSIIEHHRVITGALYGWAWAALSPDEFKARMTGSEAAAVDLSRKKPPVRETGVRDRTRDFCNCDEMALETHWSATKIRAWVLAHPHGSQVDRHRESMHT